MESIKYEYNTKRISYLREIIPLLKNMTNNVMNKLCNFIYDKDF